MNVRTTFPALNQVAEYVKNRTIFHKKLAEQVGARFSMPRRAENCISPRFQQTTVGPTVTPSWRQRIQTGERPFTSRALVHSALRCPAEPFSVHSTSLGFRTKTFSRVFPGAVRKRQEERSYRISIHGGRSWDRGWIGSRLWRGGVASSPCPADDVQSKVSAGCHSHAIDLFNFLHWQPGPSNRTQIKICSVRASISPGFQSICHYHFESSWTRLAAVT